MVSAVEIAIKHQAGKLTLPSDFEADFGGALDGLLQRMQMTPLPFDLSSAAHLATLPLHHKDPFDRMIIAQALTSDLPVATADAKFLAYDGLAVLKA